MPNKDVNPPYVSLAEKIAKKKVEKKMSRRKFLGYGGAVVLTGAAAVVEWKCRPLRKALDTISDYSPEHYSGEMDQIEVNCDALPGRLKYDVSQKMADIYADKRPEMKASGEWNPDFRNPNYWSKILARENPDGFTLESGICFMNVPKEYKDEIKSALK